MFHDTSYTQEDKIMGFLFSKVVFHSSTIKDIKFQLVYHGLELTYAKSTVGMCASLQDYHEAHFAAS